MAVTLPALSLTQPWCELVLEHGKDIENRVWNCKKRGTFLIHASAGMSLAQYASACDFAANATGLPVDTSIGIRYLPDVIVSKEGIRLPSPRDVSRGGLVGAAEILDVIPRDDPARSQHPRAGNTWLMDGCYGFVLGRRVRLPFRQYAGRQRWFNVELAGEEERVLREAGLL